LARAAESALAAGLLERLQLDTYEPEIDRYGGEEGLALAERLFHADSSAAVAILGTLSGEAGQAARWRLTLYGLSRLLDDLGFALGEKHAIAKSAREGFGREFRVDVAFTSLLGDRFRKERAALEALFTPTAAEGDYAPGIAAFDERSKAIASTAHDLRALAQAGRLTRPMADLASSYLHMHCNRMFRGAAREQELCLYDFLARLYEGQIARAGKSRRLP
jgi:thiopeptide-type bacteriocin biosynthesis protein